MMYDISVIRSVMSHPVTVFCMEESVERIVRVLKEDPHNGFPVVEDYDPDNPVVCLKS